MKLVSVLLAGSARSIVSKHAEGLGLDASFLELGIESGLGLFDLSFGIGTHPSVAEDLGGFDVLDLDLLAVSSGGANPGVLVEESHVDFLHPVALVFHLHFDRGCHGNVLFLDVAEEGPEGHSASTSGDRGAILGISFFGNLIIRSGSGPTLWKGSLGLVGWLFGGCVLGNTGRGGSQKEKCEKLFHFSNGNLDFGKRN